MGLISNGTTLLDAGALGVSTGSLVLLASQTASTSASLSFTSGIDSTYDSYVFKFSNIHPQTNTARLVFQGDTGTNTNYNQNITSTFFTSQHKEDGSGGSLGYETSFDQNGGTAFQPVTAGIGNLADENMNGELTIFNPSSSTFSKHFAATTQTNYNLEWSMNNFIAGVFNVTTAFTRFQFKMSSGNIDSGIIKLYGVV
jgi:hypothetical protein|tara:strand:+ start:104 stop:700 length:597 start_codon:yes stop_codon:yes gene_type:complete